MSLVSIRDGIANYYTHIPQNTVKQVVSSAVIGVIWGTAVSGGNLAGGITCGSLYALASLIHALITPFFRVLVEEGKNGLSWSEELGRVSLASLATTVIARSCGIPSEFSLLQVACYGGWLWLWSDPQNLQSLERTHWVPVAWGIPPKYL